MLLSVDAAEHIGLNIMSFETRALFAADTACNNAVRGLKINLDEKLQGQYSSSLIDLQAANPEGTDGASLNISVLDHLSLVCCGINYTCSFERILLQLNMLRSTCVVALEET